jgi:hypothetical protein
MEKTVRRQNEKRVAARRDFLATCGKFAIITPPAVSLLLSTTGRSYATASSGYRNCGPSVSREPGSKGIVATLENYSGCNHRRG